MSRSPSCSTTRCAVPVPGATTAASPPVSTWARSIAKISSTPDCWPRADGAERTSRSIAASRRQLADRPPRVSAGDRRRPHLVEFAEARAAELLDVDGGVAADGRDRPGRLQELPAGPDQVARAGADLLRVAHQQRRRRRAGGRSAVRARPGAAPAASASMPSTGMPSAILSSISATPPVTRLSSRGASATNSAARERTSSVEQQFPAGHGDHHAGVEFGDGALVGDREHPHLGDLVAPELDADRMLGGGREDVEDAAAHRELAAPGDHVDPAVGQFDQPRDQAVESPVRRRPAG